MSSYPYENPYEKLIIIKKCLMGLLTGKSAKSIGRRGVF